MATDAQVDTACTSTDGSAPSAMSPSHKRRSSTFRKWFSNPVRKLSQSKLEKTSIDPNKNRKVSLSAKNKVPSADDMGNKHTTPGEDATTKPVRSVSADVSADEDETVDGELPPPVEIQDSTLPEPEDLSNKRSSSLSLKPSEVSADLAEELERIMKEKMESHTEDVKQDTPETIEEIAQRAEREKTEPEPTESSELQDEAPKAHELRKRMYVLREMVETERDYVTNLGLVIDGYMATMKDINCEIAMPEDIREGRDKMVFGNIEAIYEFHRDIFLCEIEKCLEDPPHLAVTFRRYERKLHMYVVYCQNKPKSEFIVSEHIDTYFEEIRQLLGHKLQLADLLIKPVQRIMKYQLLLKDILKYTDRAMLTDESKLWQRAVQIMLEVPKAANDMMNVGRLQGFDRPLASHGKLLHQGLLMVNEGGPKVKELQVFLFEQIIIFSEVYGKRTQFSNPMYKYKNHMQVNKMALEERSEDEDTCKFVLRSKDPQQQGLILTMQCSTPEAWHTWIEKIKSLLEGQLNFLRAIQSPIAHLKELNKDN